MDIKIYAYHDISIHFKTGTANSLATLRTVGRSGPYNEVSSTTGRLHMSRTRCLTTVLAVATLALAACGSSASTSASADTSATGDTAAAAATGDTAAAPAAGDTAAAPASGDTAAAAPAGAGITIKDFTFTAAGATAGTPITITNDDGVAHTVTADDGSFDVKVSGGKTADVTIDKAGTYAFHCNIHTSMKGSITVA